MKTKNWFLLILLCSIFTFIACNKEDTDTTTTDAPASASVKYSEWATLSMAYASSDSLYEQTIVADSLTQAVLDSGIVLTYLKYETTTGQSIVVNAGLYLQEVFSAGNIQLYAGSDYSGLAYRYIIVSGGLNIGRLVAGSTAYAKEQLQAMSYAEVMKLLGKE